jgi:hypothetical protein
MDVAAVYLDLYERIPLLARRAVDGLTPVQLVERPGGTANPIGWLVWHSARVQDHHVAELLEVDQLWVADGAASRFGLGADPSNVGYGHTDAQVLEVRPESAAACLDYLEAVQERTEAYLRSLEGTALDRIVDRRWDPPVTLGVRLVSVADDSLQHLGQAAYARGFFGW